MKRTYRNLMMLLAVIALASCNSNKKEAKVEGIPSVEQIETEAPPIADDLPEEIQEEVITVEGKVQKIENGKDGYTAQVLTKDNKVYFATISIPNLDDPKQYRTVKVGDQITVVGESWKMEEQDYIRVHELK